MVTPGYAAIVVDAGMTDYLLLLLAQMQQWNGSNRTNLSTAVTGI